MLDAFPLEVRSARLLLRPWRIDEAERLCSLFANWEVIRWLSLPPWPYTVADARAFIQQDSEPTRDDAETNFAITRNGEAIGAIGVRQRPASHVQRGAGPNIGFWVGQPYWGQGLMTEALRAVVRQGFTSLPDDAIYCGAFMDNAASLRVQDKIGFQRDGECMLISRPRGAEFPHVSTVLRRADWRRSSRAAEER
jgi:RimJ/RimL family protein N-acetyltransferase